MHEARTPAEVAILLRASGSSRIAIDGTDGSGKTTLAKELASELGVAVFHLDDFVAKNRGTYIANLDAAKLANSLGQSSEGWVVEGVCILRALEALPLEPDVLVYVKRMSHGHWSDEDELAPCIPIEEHLSQLRDMVRPMAEAFGETGGLGLAEEIIRYHASHRPHEKASIAYLRADG